MNFTLEKKLSTFNCRRPSHGARLHPNEWWRIDDPNVFSDAIFNTQRLTIGPILILAGLVIEIFHILHKPKED